MNALAGAVPATVRDPSRRQRAHADALALRGALRNLPPPQWRANPYNDSQRVGACYDPNPLVPDTGKPTSHGEVLRLNHRWRSARKERGQQPITVWDQPEPEPSPAAREPPLLHPRWLAGDHTPGPVEMITIKLPLKASRFQKGTLARWGGASRYRYNKTLHFLLHQSTGTTCKQVRVRVDGVSDE